MQEDPSAVLRSQEFVAQLSKSLQSTCGLRGPVLRARASDGESTSFLKQERLGNGALGPEATRRTLGSEAEKGLVQGNPLCKAL